MAITLPLESQRDSRWSLKHLGNGNLTIGTSGCLLTCLSMICNYYGHVTTPDQLNQDLLKVNGYAEDPDLPKLPSGKYPLDLYIWKSISKIYNDVTEPKMVLTPNAVTSAQFAEIDVEIAAGRPVIIEVDFIPATAKIDMHFVIIIGKDDKGNYIIADPWYGDTASLTRYGKPEITIQRYIFTFGVLPTQPVNNPNQDEQNALGVVKEAFTALPADDELRKGNLEGYTRAIVEEHLEFAQNEIKAKAFDAFITKWLREYSLAHDPNKSDQVVLEEEMGKYLTLEDKYILLRDTDEKLVGTFANDSALIEAINAERNDKQILIDKISKLTGGKEVWVFSLGKNYILKIVKANV